MQGNAQFPKLFTPATLGPITLPNRFVVAPMTTSFGLMPSSARAGSWVAPSTAARAARNRKDFRVGESSKGVSFVMGGRHVQGQVIKKSL